MDRPGGDDLLLERYASPDAWLNKPQADNGRENPVTGNSEGWTDPNILGDCASLHEHEHQEAAPGFHPPVGGQPHANFPFGDKTDLSNMDNHAIAAQEEAPFNLPDMQHTFGPTFAPTIPQPQMGEEVLMSPGMDPAMLGAFSQFAPAAIPEVPQVQQFFTAGVSPQSPPPQQADGHTLPAANIFSHSGTAVPASNVGLPIPHPQNVIPSPTQLTPEHYRMLWIQQQQQQQAAEQQRLFYMQQQQQLVNRMMIGQQSFMPPNVVMGYAWNVANGTVAGVQSGSTGTLALSEDQTNGDTVSQSSSQGLKPAKKKTKDPNKPKRPLSAYNIFFKEQRAKMLGEQAEEEAIKDPEGDSTADIEDGRRTELTSERTKLNRKRKRHGIPFEQMAKEIGKRWRQITPESLQEIQARADTDKARYVREMAVYSATKFVNMKKPRVRVHSTDHEETE